MTEEEEEKAEEEAEETGNYNKIETNVILTHYHTIPHFDALKIYSCRKNCEKTRNSL